MVIFLSPFRYIIQKQKDPSKAHQIKLELIVKALKWLEVDMDVDEVPAFRLFLLMVLYVYLHNFRLSSCALKFEWYSYRWSA